MFREMRRKNQMLSNEESVALFKKGTSGTLALLGDDGYPYAVPMSYAYMDGKLYFHSALCGHKVDAINAYDKASFCVIIKDDVVPQKYTTYFRSVIAFGKIRILDEDAQVRRALIALAKKYHPMGTMARHDAEIAGGVKRLCVMEMTVEHLSGKEAIELTGARQTDV